MLNQKLTVLNKPVRFEHFSLLIITGLMWKLLWRSRYAIIAVVVPSLSSREHALSMFSYTAGHPCDLPHHRPAVLCNLTYISISMLCNYRRDSFIPPITHSQQTQHYKKMFYSQFVSFYWLQKSFWQSKAGPDAESKRVDLKKKKHGQRNSEEEGREGVKRICFLSSAVPILFSSMDGLSLSLSPWWVWPHF